MIANELGIGLKLMFFLVRKKTVEKDWKVSWVFTLIFSGFWAKTNLMTTEYSVVNTESDWLWRNLTTRTRIQILTDTRRNLWNFFGLLSAGISLWHDQNVCSKRPAKPEANPWEIVCSLQWGCWKLQSLSNTKTCGSVQNQAKRNGYWSLWGWPEAFWWKLCAGIGWQSKWSCHFGKMPWHQMALYW